MHNEASAPLPEDTPDEETIYPQKPYLTYTPDPTKTKAHRQVVGMKNAGGEAYGKATGLYNKRCKYSEQWNPWLPFQSAHDIQQAQSFSQRTKMWIDQHLMHGLDNLKIESFQSAEALQKLLSQLDLGFGDDSWIEDHSHIFGTLYYRDIFKCIQFLLAHLPFQAHLDFKLVHVADSRGHRIYSEMNTGDWWWDMLDQLPARATVVPVIYASDMTHLTKFLGSQHTWPLYIMIGNICGDIGRTPIERGWILVGLIPWPPKGAYNTDEVWHSAVGTLLSQLWNIDITGPSLKWNCADGFHRHLYPQLEALVGDLPERVMIAQVSYGSCLVLATGPGNPPAVRVLTCCSVRFGSRTGQKPEPLLSWRVVTRPGHRTAVIWPGWNRTAVPNIRFLQLWLQLSIWVLIVSWDDQYVSCAVLAPLSPPAFRFAIGLISVERLWNTGDFYANFAGFR